MTTTTNTTNAPQSFVIGVTGNIACGKSAVLDMLGELGAETIDADRVYHGLIQPGRPLWQALIERFGTQSLSPNGRIDRRALGAIVYNDPKALADLDALTHPAVVEEIDHMISESAAEVIAVDAVKLIESGMDAHCDRVWVVTCQPEQQIERLMQRNGLDKDEAQRRIDAQPPIAPKLDRADLVIDNSGSLEETRQQVKRAWDNLPAPKARSGH